MMYYILQKDIMQIMNLEKIVKNLWWSLTAFRTINNLLLQQGKTHQP